MGERASSGGRVVVSGASGLIGRALAASLHRDGIEVVRLVRRAPRSRDEIEWSPGESGLAPAVIEGADAVICLNGASIGRLPWTPRYRRTLRESRLVPTRTIAAALRSIGTGTPHFVAASAVGFYGDRPGEYLTEESGRGETFLARLTDDWEQEALTAGPHARVSLLRTAPVLHREGVLKPLLLLTKLGVSGPLGAGTQIWPWISLEDEVRAIRHVIGAGVLGPVNLSGPEPASSNEIGHEIARRLHRPYALPAPAWALRPALGSGAADSLLLSDALVMPKALLGTGFEFTHPTAQEAIAAAI